jgi:hypothetical protein
LPAHIASEILPVQLAGAAETDATDTAAANTAAANPTFNVHFMNASKNT